MHWFFWIAPAFCFFPPRIPAMVTPKFSPRAAFLPKSNILPQNSGLSQNSNEIAAPIFSHCISMAIGRRTEAALLISSLYPWRPSREPREIARRRLSASGVSRVAFLSRSGNATRHAGGFPPLGLAGRAPLPSFSIAKAEVDSVTSNGGENLRGHRKRGILAEE